MSARLRALAKETEGLVATGRYRTARGVEVAIGEAVARAVRGTRMYGPGPVDPGPRTERTGPTAFEVTGEDSLQAARRLVRQAPGVPVAVLNFASARNPGGGYLNGAQAQEEAVCRASALYTTLLTARQFYDWHRADRSPFYSDRVIHSPAVPVFRDEHGVLLDEPFEAGFLTSAAPNAGVIARQDPGATDRVPAALTARAGRVLEVAAAHGYPCLVLGAWGCGVFRNDPAAVAAAFREHLWPGGRFADRFGRVVFAVLDRRADSPTRAAFAAAFPG
ncbi:TIGR02452 family protein [Streptomyces sp. PA03-1a]|nr:TIGR02452 family protein [Streptomyces sp. PA03-1a]MDX2815143.1 TIGR02452 family protein [Streptomyces sp. PA03-5A]